MRGEPWGSRDVRYLYTANTELSQDCGNCWAEAGRHTSCCRAGARLGGRVAADGLGNRVFLRVDVGYVDVGRTRCVSLSTTADDKIKRGRGDTEVEGGSNRSTAAAFLSLGA